MKSERTPDLPLSVIVLAHDRKTYLEEAVRSVAEQDLSRSRFEIIVVKNYPDAAIDQYLAQVRAQSVLCTETPGAAKVLAGFERSRGRIVCVLDDDDIYEPSRLRSVLAAFEADPQLGFYRNRFSSIGFDGLALRGNETGGFGLRRVHRPRSLTVDDLDKSGIVPRLVGEFPDFNISCSAVRREVVLSALPYLRRLQMTVDTLFFFSALVSGYSLFLDGGTLTRYRVHEAASSRAGTGATEARLQQLQRFASITDADYRIVREFVARTRPEEFLKLIDARIWVNRLTMAFRSSNTRRRDILQLLLDLPPFVDTYPVREHILGVLGVVPFIVSPSLGRLLYQHQILVR